MYPVTSASANMSIAMKERLENIAGVKAAWRQRVLYCEEYGSGTARLKLKTRGITAEDTSGLCASGGRNDNAHRP